MRNLKQNQTLNHSMHHSDEPNELKDLLKRIPILFNFAKSVYFLLHLNSRRRWTKLLQSKEVKLNLGSGPTRGKNGWVNVDLFGADINRNLLKEFLKTILWMQYIVRTFLSIFLIKFD